MELLLQTVLLQMVQLRRVLRIQAILTQRVQRLLAIQLLQVRALRQVLVLRQVWALRLQVMLVVRPQQVQVPQLRRMQVPVLQQAATNQGSTKVSVQQSSAVVRTTLTIATFLSSLEYW